MNQSQSGFSVIKFLFWIAVLGLLVSIGFKLLDIYQTSWKVQDVFDGISHNLADSSEETIRKKLPTLFKVGYIDHDDLPEEFYANIKIRISIGRVEISSSYQETLWPLGPVEKRDAEGMYHPDDLTGLDVWRDKTRQDFYFEPYAKTP